MCNLCWFYSLFDLPTHGRVARRRRAARGPLLESPAHRGALQASSGTRQAGLEKGLPLVSSPLYSTSNHPWDRTPRQSSRRHLDGAFNTNQAPSGAATDGPNTSFWQDDAWHKFVLAVLLSSLTDHSHTHSYQPLHRADYSASNRNLCARVNRCA